MCGSTCFGHHPAHHQEHTTAIGASGFTVGQKRLSAHHQEHTTELGASGFTVGGKQLEHCWSWFGRPRPTMLQPLLSNGKTRGS